MDTVTTPWGSTITTGQRQPYGGPGQLTRAEYLYLFGEQDGLAHPRRIVKSWAEWEAFLAKWDEEQQRSIDAQKPLSTSEGAQWARGYRQRRKPIREPRPGGASAA